MNRTSNVGPNEITTEPLESSTRTHKCRQPVAFERFGHSAKHFLSLSQVVMNNLFEEEDYFVLSQKTGHLLEKLR